jgi:hypothetical protein
MSEHDFQSEVLQQLGNIEGKQDMIHEELRSQQNDIKGLRTDATKALESAKSAHHRINLIMAILGAMGSALVYIVVKIIWG